MVFIINEREWKRFIFFITKTSKKRRATNALIQAHCIFPLLVHVRYQIEFIEPQLICFGLWWLFMEFKFSYILRPHIKTYPLNPIIEYVNKLIKINQQLTTDIIIITGIELLAL